MPQAMKDKMRAFTAEISREIQDINGDTTLTPKQQAQKIGNLKGAPKEDMFMFLNQNYRVGADLADEIKKLISKDRPRGGPSMSDLKKRLKGTK